MSVDDENSLVFSRISEADLDELLVLEAAGHAIPWSREIFQDCMRAGYYCVLVRIDQVIVVYAVLSAAAGEAHILNVCVNKSYLRQGYGRKAVLHLLDIAKHNNVQTVFLEVRPSNVKAIDLYESLGFLEIGQRKGYYPKKSGGREDALVLAVELGSCFDEMDIFK